jgi:hypothetical protein
VPPALACHQYSIKVLGGIQGPCAFACIEFPLKKAVNLQLTGGECQGHRVTLGVPKHLQPRIECWI